MSAVYPVAQVANPPRHSCLHHLLKSQAERTPDALAILAPGRVALTYGRLYRHIDEVVQTLHAMGVGRNDRVAVVLPNGPEMAVAFLAVAAGATCAPLNPAYSVNEFDFYLTDLHARALILHREIDSAARSVAQARGVGIVELSPMIEAEAGLFTLTGEEWAHPGPHASVAPDDVALVLHTSGATSWPKIVPLTHANICTAAYRLGTALTLAESDRCLNMLPLFHVFGLVSTLLVSLAAGTSTVCLPGFCATQFFAWLAEFRPTWYPAVPTMHQAILAHAAQHRETIRRCPPRFIRSGAAPLPPSVRVELERVFHTQVFEGYGMTETSGGITSHPPPLRGRKVGSVGVAVGAEIAIMDEVGTMLAAGETGEIVVRGATVFRGYDNAPEANRNAFMHGWFRTGDKGYLDADGYLFAAGRLNKQIINRGGEQIALREVDDVLMAHPAVAQAVTFAVPHAQLGEDIAAAVILHQDAVATENDIRAFAVMHLAAFKIPRHVCIVNDIPKGPTGKPLRLGLAEKLGLAKPDRAQSERQADFTAPHTPLQEMLTGLWAQMLDVERVGIHDDFFRLGGESILAMQLLSRIREVTHIEVPYLNFFEAPTVAGMARSIETARRTALDLQAPPLQPVTRDGALPLSYAQQRLWFLDQLGLGGHAYNLLHVLRLRGNLHVPALGQSLQEITRRHEVLRTTFTHVEGQPYQVIEPVRPVTLQVVELQNLPADEREAQVRILARAEAQRPFNLAQGPLMRATLLRLAATEHVLLLTLHHMVFDGWSVEIFWRELSALYAAFCTGKPVSLPELPIQYVDFAVWQRQWLQGEVLKAQLAYWPQHLGGRLPVLDLPTDRPRPPRQTFEGAHQELQLSSQLTAALKALSQQTGVTLFMTLLAAFQTVLFRYTGQIDLLVGTPIAGRTRVETEGLIGFFVNTLVLRTNLGGNPRFRELLGRVRAVALGAYAHQELPFEQLVEALQPVRDLSRHALFQVMFVLQNAPQAAWEFPDLHVSPVSVDRGVALFDLTLFMRETEQGLQGIFEYRTDLFDPATIARMGTHFQTLLEGIVANPEQRLTDIPLLTEAERQQVLVAWNDTQTSALQTLCLHQLFEAQVERTPEAIAVVCAEQHLTYRELNQRANRLAHHLCALGVGPEVLVGLCTERSLEMMVGLLGILKAGGAYVPLDPAYPQERLAFMVVDARVAVVVTQQRLARRLPDYGTQVVYLDTNWDDIAPGRTDNVDSGVTVENLAYVMYTSGSTGTPKGAMIPHQGLVNYLAWCTTAYGVADGQGAPVHSSIGFDATITSLFSPLLVGKRVVLLPEAPGIERLSADLGAHSDFSFVKITPAHLELLGEQISSQKVENATKALIIGGEALSEKSLELWRTYASHIRLMNEYGPTETVVGCCVFEVSAQTSLSGTVPIGRPIANTRIYILDRHLQPVPISVPGELHIGGVGLARGYFNHPEWTAEKFIPNPFSEEPGARLYKTGDLARYLPDGNIEFLGRLDDQAKIRGFRIELGEIETVLGQHPDVRETVVMVREDYPADKRLVAYIAAKQARNPGASDLRRFLKQKLPDYMVPSTFVMLNTLPLTPNGKVDRQALPVPDQTRPELADVYTAPRTQVERTLTAVWQEVLHVEQVGIHDNFFDLGGHSLLMVQVHSKLRGVLSKDVSIVDLFTYPTISSLATYVSQEQNAPPSLQPSQDRARSRRESMQRRKQFIHSVKR